MPRSAVCLLACALLPVVSRAAEARHMEVQLDARQARLKLLSARLVVPAMPGPLTLCCPRWIPGEHGPTGPIADLSGLKITAKGKPVVWKRDGVDLYSFHCTVPEGADGV